MDKENLVEWSIIESIQLADKEGALEILRAYVKWVTTGIEGDDDICTFHPETGKFSWRKKESRD